MVIRSGLLGALGMAAALSLTAPAFAEGPERDSKAGFILAGQSYHQGTTGYPNQDELAKAAAAALELGYLIYKESKYKDRDDDYHDDHYREVDYGHGKKHKHGYWHKHGYGGKHWHDHGHKHGHYKKKHKKKRYKHGHGHGHGHYKHHNHKHDYGNYRDSDHYPWRYDKRGYKRHVKVHRFHGGYDCHPVKKKGYFHGRPAKVGGTMCYDRYGNAYIAKGSRYVIKYLDY